MGRWKARARSVAAVVSVVGAVLVGVTAPGVGRPPVAGATVAVRASSPTAPVWTEQSPATSPPGRTLAAIATDQATGDVVVFGGAQGSSALTPLDDTWVWNGSDWLQEHPATSPPALFGASMAYDPATADIVLFGGTGGSLAASSDETWVWDGSDWSQRVPATSPPARSGGSLAFDEATGSMLLFGGTDGTYGADGAVPLDDTWTWDGSDWTELFPATVPQGRADAAMAFDPATGNLVLTSGESNAFYVAGPSFQDTWTWDGNDWTLQSPGTEPPETSGQSTMVFDPVIGQLVLCFYGREMDTWSWNGTDWSELTDAGVPSSTWWSSLAFDPATGELVLFGGLLGQTAGNDTWTYAPILPGVTGLSPSVGPTAGGTAVTVTGTGLAGATAVDFGSSPAATFSCTETACSATSPPESSGEVTVTVTTPLGTSPGVPSAGASFTYATTAAAAAFQPVDPLRICDTRAGQTQTACPGATRLGPGGTLTVQATGNGIVPVSGVSAVVVNVTATDTTATSYLAVYPGGQNEPTTSDVHWTAGQTIPSLVTVGLSPSGAFDIGNFAGDVDVVVDVEGYFAAGAAGSGLFEGLTDPARICDTRAGNPSGLSGVAQTQCEGAVASPGTPIDVAVAGLGGVPSTGVEAVVLNVTATDASSPGHLTVYSADDVQPLASNVNYTAGEVVPNRVIVPLGSDGSVDILSSAGDPGVVVDVSGWFTDRSDASAAGTEFTPAVTPIRICDTRTGPASATPCAGNTLGAGSVLPVTVAGVDDIPAGVTAVVVDITATDTTTMSHLSAYPAGYRLPDVSDLNWTAGRTVSNFDVVDVGPGNLIYLENLAGSADVVVDLVGWFS